MLSLLPQSTRQEEQSRSDASAPPLQAALLVLNPAVTLERVLEVTAALGLNVISLMVRNLAKESTWIDQSHVHRILARLVPGEEDKIMSPFVQAIIDEARPKFIDEGRAEALLSLLKRKFGDDLTLEKIEQVRAANGSQLEETLNGILDANKIEDVLAPSSAQ